MPAPSCSSGPAMRHLERHALRVAVVLEDARLRLDRARLVLVRAAGRDVRRAVIVERGAHAGARCESYIPHSSRSSLQISPIVQRARSASRSGGSMFSVAARRVAHARERGLRLVGVPLRAHPRGPLELPPLGRRDRAGAARSAPPRPRGSGSRRRSRARPTRPAAGSGTPPARSRPGRSPARSPRPRRRARRPARSAPSARCSSSSVSDSMKYEPPSGSAVSVRAGLAREDLLRAQRDAAPRARTAARAPRRTSSCAATARRRTPPTAPGSRRARRCSAAAAR